jgi:hypothetical protein
MAKRNYYEILGINKDANEGAIKKAYRDKKIMASMFRAAIEIFRNFDSRHPTSTLQKWNERSCQWLWNS